VAYEVSGRKEVERKLHELGVDSVRDVRRAGGAYRHDVHAVLQAEQLNLQTHGSPDSMAAVTADLLEISGQIRGVRDELHGMLGEIRRLGGHQFDGWGPIADRMAAHVSDRAGPDSGAERALTSYLAELANLDTVLTQTAALYGAIEDDNIEQLRRTTHSDG
jgi:uncharacterized membrane protein YdfJ with MMPL/SSD domain